MSAQPDLTRTQLSPIEDIVGPMTSCQLFAIFEELAVGGDALAAISRHDRIERIVAAVQSLHDVHADTFQRLITECAAQIRWSEAMVRYVIEDFVSLISETSLHTLVREELGPENAEGTFVAHPLRATAQMLVPPEVVLHILGSTIPTTAMETMILSLAAGIPTVIRTSAHERACARFFLDVLRKEAPELARHVAVVTWPHDDAGFAKRIAQAQPQVVFHGSDTAIHAFEQTLPEAVDIHRFGHRISFGLVAPSGRLVPAAVRRLAERIAWDATLFEGQGCMSMQTLFVRPHPDQPKLACHLAETIAQQGFARLRSQFPRQRLPDDIAAAQMQQCGIAEFSGEVWSGPDGNALCWKDPQLRASPGFRHLHVSTVPDMGELLDVLAPYHHALSTAGIAIPEASVSNTAKLLASAGVRRICRIGRMQRPILLGAHDGRAKIRPWFRICEREG